MGIVLGGDFLLCFATRSVCLILIAVIKHHDQGQLKEDAFNWETAYSFGESMNMEGVWQQASKHGAEAVAESFYPDPKAESKKS